MSISRVPDPDFFSVHQGTMDQIREDVRCKVDFYARELNQYVSYIDDKISTCQYIKYRYESLTSEDMENMDPNELDRLREEYYYYDSVFEQLKQVRVKCEDFIDRKRIIESRTLELEQRMDSVKWILKNTVRNYHDSR